MAGRTPLSTQPSPTTLASPAVGKSRRESTASASIVSSQTDKDNLAQALDKIHTSASKADSLTTFNDIAPPPELISSPEIKGFAGDLVQNGFSGLYSRFKEAVGVAPVKEKHPALDDLDGLDALSKRSTSTAASVSKTSIASFPRVDTGFTSGAYNHAAADQTASGSATEAPSQQSQSTKVSSVTNLTSPSTVKSVSSSRQSIPSVNVTKATAAVAPVTVNAFKDSSRPDVASRAAGGRQSLGRPGEGQQALSGADIAALQESPELKSAAALEKIAVPNRARRDDGYSIDGSNDSPISPTKNSIAAAVASNRSFPISEQELLSPPLRQSARDLSKRPAVINRISQSNVARSHSRSSSKSRSTAEPSPVSTSAHNSVHHGSFAREDNPQRMRTGAYKIPGTTTDEGAPEMVNATLEHMRKQVLSKDFWMADEACKECFHCGSPFSAFRRKHHCRTCGCIFDSKCTSIISGQRFGVPGTLRVCKPCLNIISQRQDGNASDDSADDTYLPAIFRPVHKQVRLTIPQDDKDTASVSDRTEDVEDDSRSLATPLMTIPAARRIGESSNRNSAVLEIDAAQLSRPSSSRSLKALAARPQSSGHRRHHSKHNFLNRFRGSPAADERAPFRAAASEEAARRKSAGLPAFHDDNVIDPDLAPFMSDESSGDEQMSIFQTMTSSEPKPSSLEHEKPSFGPYLGAGRRNRLRTQGEKSVSGFSFNEGSGVHPRPSRRRNMSTASASVHHLRSPRPKSAVLKGPSGSTETLPNYENQWQTEPPRLTRSSSMKGDKEPRVELNPASLLHVRKLLRQVLQDSEIPNAPSWEKALVPILLKCTTSVDPDVERGDDIDIRHYVKLKKIPGARPGDTSYVSGVIFTKKLALKSMPRRIANPRVVIVSFPVEYKRHQQHFMSLQPAIAEEKEYLKVIVNRLLALRPQVILAEKSVSVLALQYLAEANVAVAYNVKASVLSAVARCLETPILSSIDMLSLPIERFQIGKGVNFEVKTYVNEEIPGRKKTYIFLSGAQEPLGCTIALRGAPTETLRKVKRITEFMVYVVYNLKLESCLMRDSFIQLPTSEDMPINTSQTNTDEIMASQASLGSTSSGDRQRTLSTISFAEDPAASQKQHESEAPSTTGEGSNGDGQTQPSQTSQPSEHLLNAHASHESAVPEDVPMPTYYSDMVAKYQTKILSASPFVKFSQPYLLMTAREQERRLVHLKRLRDQDVIIEGEKQKSQKFHLIKPEMVHQTGHKAPRQFMEVLHAVHDAEYDKALYNYQTQTRQWENYIHANIDLFEPYAHQNIVVLHSVICTETKVPCVEPGLIAIAFYDEHTDNSDLDPDCTLGQYIEDICFSTDAPCSSNNCDRKMLDHHRTYVHGEARITIFIEKDFRGTARRDNIMMWSYCKLCKRETSEMEMSRATWKYSFGKYLELSFWSRGTQLVKNGADGGWDCPHDHHRDHIRYFGLQDKVIRVHHDPIDLLEIIVPRARITWKVEHDLNLKNGIFTACQEKWTKFTNSVKARLKAIKLDSIPPDKADICKAEMERMTKKIQEEHVALVQRLQGTYMNSKYYEVIPFNIILREMLEKVAEWDGAFTKFEADFLPSEKDIRRVAMLQLRKMVFDESKESLSSTDSTTEATESMEKTTQATHLSAGSDGDSKNETQPTDVDSSQPGTSTQTSPVEVMKREQILAADATMDRAEPLDLATPRSPGQNLLSTTQPASSATMPQSIALPDNAFALPDVTLPNTAVPPTSNPASSMSVTEQVEQLRRRQQASLAEVAGGEKSQMAESSRNLADLSRVLVQDRGTARKTGLTVSPPLVRAFSQPANTVPSLPRSHSGVGKKLFGLIKDKDKEESLAVAEAVSGTELTKIPTNESSKGEKKIFGVRSRPGAAKSSIPRFVGKKKESRVSNLARHFEQLSREFEKERMKDRKQRAAKMTHNRAFLQRSSTKAIVEVYEDPDEAAHEPGPVVDELARDVEEPKLVEPTSRHMPSVPETAEAPSQESQSPTDANKLPEDTMTEAETDDQTLNTSQAASDDEQGESDAEQSLLEGSTLEEIAQSIDSSTEIPLELPKQDKMNFIKVLSNFWNERSASEWPPLEYPLKATDHIFIDSDIIVREDEPSSLVAFALSCEDYKAKARRFHRRRAIAAHDTPTDSEDEGGTESSFHLEEGPMVRDEALEASFIRETSSHLKYQFNEGSAKMMVKIFYAEQFDALRRKCGAAERIVESLSRCMQFDSKGGKTKSVFLKTQDDRLMMKSLSPIETSAFLKFAPSYFGIMAEALFHELPSVIAKMLGFFQVIIKNPVTNTEIKLDLLLMENLFYDRAPTRIFDLKGSMRNRKIQSTGEQNEVLLDENMVEYIYESPLFAREHSKKLLRASVWNDTLFLARQNVMDYSLMIAVDEVRRELVVGIIDCIRTYTWDKTLESWIKGRGFAGGGRNRPTVTSPKEYKSRFREAMARYILQAPNCWHQFNTPLHAPRPAVVASALGEDQPGADEAEA